MSIADCKTNAHCWLPTKGKEPKPMPISVFGIPDQAKLFDMNDDSLWIDYPNYVKNYPADDVLVQHTNYLISKLHAVRYLLFHYPQSMKRKPVELPLTL